jgi:preprotein translocase subunit SecG
VSEETSPFNLILFINSVFTIGLILNQNENTKDSANKQNQSSSANPLEKITWVCVVLQFFLLLVKVKISHS